MKRAFTLIELMIVVAIVAILVSMAIRLSKEVEPAAYVEGMVVLVEDGYIHIAPINGGPSEIYTFNGYGLLQYDRIRGVARSDSLISYEKIEGEGLD